MEILKGTHKIISKFVNLVQKLFNLWKEAEIPAYFQYKVIWKRNCKYFLYLWERIYFDIEYGLKIKDIQKEWELVNLCLKYLMRF